MYRRINQRRMAVSAPHRLGTTVPETIIVLLALAVGVLVMPFFV